MIIDDVGFTTRQATDYTYLKIDPPTVPSSESGLAQRTYGLFYSVHPPHSLATLTSLYNINHATPPSSSLRTRHKVSNQYKVLRSSNLLRRVITGALPAISWTMSKRPLDHHPDFLYPQVKRPRTSPVCSDPLSPLSDEILLRILSFLPVSQLVVCQRCVNLQNPWNIISS